MDDDSALLRNIRMFECRRPSSRHRLRMMGSAAKHVGRGDSDKRLPARTDKAGVEVSQDRALSASRCRRQAPVREALHLNPAMRSIARRSSSTAATKSSRDPAFCLSATKARKASLGAAIFEKSGVTRKAAFRRSTLIRFASFFHSSRPRYSRAASLRAAASLIVSSQPSACRGTPASPIHCAPSQ